MNWADVLKAVIPIIVASLAWLLGQVNDFSTRLTRIEGAMPALITKEGEIGRASCRERVFFDV